MFQKNVQRVGRWWMIARFRSHLQKNSHQWAVLGIFSAFWITLIVVVAVLRTWLGETNKWGEVLPVAGHVLLDNHPLNGGFVKFHADAAKGNKTQFSPAGEIDANGNYELRTGNRKGAPPGWYRVVIAAAETEDGSHRSSKPTFNSKYTRDDKTPLRMEVKANGEYTLKLTK